MEPELIGGNWIQTNAYLLNDIKELIEKYTGNTININVEPTPVTVNPTPVQTEVILQQNITLPRQTQYVHNPLPILTPAPNTTFRVVTNYINPAPLIIDIDKMNAYSRVCGAYNPINDGYSYCMQCVDAWLVANQDGFELQQLTRSGTGCTTKKPKRCCKPNGMPY
jgi:hypothetical protein